MPEGHSVHRIARQFTRNFVGQQVRASSPQGRFAAGAERIDGLRILSAKAVGKQMFLEFEGDVWLRVHLGIYGAWEFSGALAVDRVTRKARARMRDADDLDGTGLLEDAREHEGPALAEASSGSTVRSRRSRVRMAEQEQVEGGDEDDQDDDETGAESEESGDGDGPLVSREEERTARTRRSGLEGFPPEPVGAVRVRLLAENVVADLRGPTACEVEDPAQVDAAIAKLGPDPLVDDLDVGERRFVETVRKKRTPIGLLLMDQAVVSGIGNIYRAELLFRQRIDPHRPGNSLTDDEARALWRDWAQLLAIGTETGQMLTMDRDEIGEEAYAESLKNRRDRHFVYKREGEPCRLCGTEIVLEVAAGRKLYFCPKDQT